MKRLLLFAVCYGLAASHSFAAKVLILSTTVSGGVNSLEAQVAAGLGFQVDVVTPAVWGNIPAGGPNGFSSYRAIILGDPECGAIGALAAAEANRATWSPTVNGNVIVVGTDPAFPHAGGPQLTTNAIRFAVDQPNQTGLYISLSCYYQNAASATPVSVLDQFGAFTIHHTECYNQAHVVATHPAMIDLTDAILSNWSCSVHEGFQSWPGSFMVLAIAENAGTSFTGPDLSVGSPYILARGVGLMPVTNRFQLSPAYAANPTNSQHTVCAIVVIAGALASGINVTFTVTSGPNVGTTATAPTGLNGIACFTYTGTGGVGSDTIIAEYVDAQSQTVTADAVTKNWYDPCGSTALIANGAMAICESNVVFVFFNEIVDSVTATNTFDYTLDNGLTVTNVEMRPGNASVAVSADQNFISGVTYTLQITGVSDLCGRMITPNPFTLTFQCDVLCPGLQCPTNIVVQCAGTNGTEVDYEVEIDPSCTNVTLTCSPPPHSLFPVGVTLVTCLATIGTNSQTTNSCSFTVTVVDTLPPVIDCPSNLIVFTTCSTALVPFTVTASDNCCPHPTVVCTPSSPALLAAGASHVVHCVATDCTGNTNSCDFSIQVVQIADTGPMSVSFPTNVIICMTNGCGPMPDAAAQVQVSNGGTVHIGQSIPPGTILCTNTSVTFSITNACGDVTNCVAPVLLTPCCCAALRTLKLPTLLTNITIWEHTSTATPHTFSIQPFDPKLFSIPGGPTATNADFVTADEEFYDVYLSRADGTPDTNGCCVTIVCNQLAPYTDYQSGNNIDAIELDFADGTHLGASSFGAVQLGQGLTDPNLLFGFGQAENGLGLHDGDSTVFGHGLSQATFCFATPCPPTIVIAIPQPGTVVLHWTNFLPHVPWVVQHATNVHGPWNVTTNGVTSPFTNAVGPGNKFFKLKLGP